MDVLRCSQSSEEGARCLETPEWMFDRAVCCGMVHGDSPRVSRAALYSLKALISGGFGGSSGGGIEARSYSLSQEGEADAPGAGLVDSLARPGGNVTGFMTTDRGLPPSFFRRWWRPDVLWD